MATKPAAICKLEKGKIIDAQKGFVDTFNWMVELLDDMTKGNLAKVQEVTLVTGAKYDESSHRFTVTTRKANVVVVDAKANSSTVFEAVPYTEED